MESPTRPGSINTCPAASVYPKSIDGCGAPSAAGCRLQETTPHTRRRVCLNHYHRFCHAGRVRRRLKQPSQARGQQRVVSCVAVQAPFQRISTPVEIGSALCGPAPTASSKRWGWGRQPPRRGREGRRTECTAALGGGDTLRRRAHLPAGGVIGECRNREELILRWCGRRSPRGLSAAISILRQQTTGERTKGAVSEKADMGKVHRMRTSNGTASPPPPAERGRKHGKRFFLVDRWRITHSSLRMGVGQRKARHEHFALPPSGRPHQSHTVTGSLEEDPTKREETKERILCPWACCRS